MAFWVVDSEFNRANYPNIIGKVYEVAPSYVQVQPVEFIRKKQESNEECADLATKVIKIYAVSDALTHGWDYLEPERRAESLGRLKKRVGDLSENKHISETSASRVMGSLALMESINKGAITQQHVSGILLPAVVDMAVQAIGDCVCGDKLK